MNTNIFKTIPYPRTTDLIKRIHALVGPQGKTPIFKTVGGTGSLQRIMTQQVTDTDQLPGIFVTPGPQTSGSSSISNGITQVVSVSYFVVIVLPMTDSLSGLNQADDTEETYIAAAHWAVLGARVAMGRNNGKPMQFSNGEPYLIDQSRYSYKLEYQIDIRLTDDDTYKGELADLVSIDQKYDIKQQ